ncbi:MAG: DUF3352 domain-containing protein, partial [Actinomycetota bacterium]|nr:DUF3352 domain-containing protein [Actinomycetota bacterium]
ALALAGCGGGGDDAASPLDDALGYLSEDAPFAVSIDTDIRGAQYDALGRIAGRFPFGEQLKQRLKDTVEEQGGRLEDIEPLLGNEFVLGAARVDSLTGTTSDTDDFVGAIKTRSADKLEATVKREKAVEEGERNGAKVYRDNDGDPFAVKDDVLIVAGSRGQLESALAQREADDRLTEETFEEGTRGLPKDALLRVYGDLQRILAADPTTKDARRIKWVKALRTFGATASFKGDEANVDFRLNTEAADLTEEDLPFASGSDAPSVIDRAGEIAAAVKDPAQIVDFAERAAQATDPAGFGDFETLKRAVEKELDIDIERDVLKQLEGEVAVTFAVNGNYGVRAELKDPDEFDRTLAKVGKVLPKVAERVAGKPVRYARPAKGGDFYALATADGERIVYGVKDGVFVLASDSRRARQLAKKPTKSVPATKGAVVVNADAEQVARRILGQLQGQRPRLLGRLLTAPLDELTGSMSAARDGVTGNFKLTFD